MLHKKSKTEEDEKRRKSSSLLHIAIYGSIYFVIFLAAVIFCLPDVRSQEDVMKDVSVIITLPSQVNESEHTKFAKITNNDDISGINDNLSVLVTVNFSHGESFTQWNVTKTINSYSEAGLGTLNFETGTYILCVSAEELNFYDYAPENNSVCAEIIAGDESSDSNTTELNESDANVTETNSTVNESINTTSNTSLNITNNTTANISNTTNTSSNITDASNATNTTNLTNTSEPYTNTSSTSNSENISESVNCSCIFGIETEKEIFYAGEKLEFTINGCENGSSKYLFPVEYWIEDRNEIVKSVVSTENKASKSYTPSIVVEEKYFLIKTRIQNCTEETKKLVVFVNASADSNESDSSDSSDSSGETETFLEMELSGDLTLIKENEIIYVSLSGYKGNSAKTLISVWLEKDGKKESSVTKVYINKKNSAFSFKIPLILDVEKSGEYTLIAEGLGETEEIDVDISVETDESDEDDSEDNDNNEEQSADEDGIISFYTRKKIFAENITVYISVNYPEGKTLVISGEKNNISLKNISEKNTINISITSAGEKLTAELYEGKVLIDSAVLQLNLTGGNEQEEKQDETESSSEDVLGENSGSSSGISDALEKEGTGNVQLLQTDSTENKSENISSDRNLITGAAIETGAIKEVELDKKSAVFIICAVLLAAMFFSRKIREKTAGKAVNKIKDLFAKRRGKNKII